MQRLRQNVQSYWWAVGFGVMYLISQACIGQILRAGDAGQLLFKFQFSFSAEHFRYLLTQLSTAQIQALQKHFIVDHIHPLWYGGLAFCLTAWQLNRLNKSSNWTRLLWLAPFMSLMDIIENLLHQPLFLQTQTPTEGMVFIAAFCASVKWSLALLFVLLNAYLTLSGANTNPADISAAPRQ